MFNKLFEGLDTKEQNAVKFAFELVDKIQNAAIVKLKANGTTGYPVYYLYLNFLGEGDVLRILKQGRKCKLMSFGNPKIVWAFVNDGKAKMPTRKEATVEYVGNCLKHLTTGNYILNWVNEKLHGNITFKDFGISDSDSNNAVKAPAKSVSKPVAPAKPVKNETEKKKALITKLLKEDIAKAKKSKYETERSYITIEVYRFFMNHKKELQKYYPKEYAYEDLENDFYSLGIYNLDFSGYTKDYQIHKPSGWLRNERQSHITEINYIAKPCKEFESLNKYITSILKCKALGMNDVMRQGVAGKRSTIFERYNTMLLAHQSDKCKRIKAELQKMKKSNWSAKIDLKKDMYWGDRFNSYGEDMETEWSGTETHYALITFTTPSGKKVGEYEIWP